MQYELKEAALLLAAGFFFIGVLETFVYVVFGRTVYPYKAASEIFPPLGSVGLVLATVLMVGLCLDAFSKRWVGRTSTPPSWAIPAPPWLLPTSWLSTYPAERERILTERIKQKAGTSTSSITQVLLPAEKELRAHPLFNPQNASHPKGEPTSGLLDLLSAGVIGRCGGSHGTTIQKVYDKMSDEGKLSTSALAEALDNANIGSDARIGACASTFYKAKNAAYDHESYFTELRGIETRSDFARTMVLCCYALAWLMVVILFIWLGVQLVSLGVLRLVGRGVLKEPDMGFWARAIRWSRARRSAKTNITAAIGLFVGAIFGVVMSREAYLSNQHAFNSRVFGYFASLEAGKSGEPSKPDAVKEVPKPNAGKK